MPSLKTVADTVRAHVTPESAARLVDGVAASTVYQGSGEAPRPLTPEEQADAIVDVIDALIPWAVIIPGWGALIESADGPVVKAAIHAVMRALAKQHHAQATTPP